MTKNGATRPPNEWEKFRAATRQVLSVSKEELTKREKDWRKGRTKKRQTRKNTG